MKILSVILLLTIFACAPPTPEFEKQDFIPRTDVVAVSLYNEGVTLYKAGRFLDSEMRLRQALYLYPDAENILSSLALVLKSSGLFDESIEIYMDLIRKNPSMNDYKFALADAYFRAKRFEDATNAYQQAMIAFEVGNETEKTATAARSLAALYFQIGDEERAFCFSSMAITYLNNMEQILRHSKILLALSMNKDADVILQPQMQVVPPPQNPPLIKLAALTQMALGNEAEAKKLIQMAADILPLDLPDVELVTIQKLIDAEGLDQETSSANNEGELIFNESLLLYWPTNLVRMYYEKLGTRID